MVMLVKPNINRWSEMGDKHPLLLASLIKGTLFPALALNVGIGCKSCAAKSNKNSF